MATERPAGTALLQDGATADSPGTLASQFDLLSDESRLQIIGALYRTGSRSPTETLPFSAIFDRTGIADTGQFNYHLRRLRGQFVEKAADGYYLTPAGTVVGRMLDGSDGASDDTAPSG